MLFYDKHDAICLKLPEGKYKQLYDRDIVELNGKFYTYSNDYFYDVIDYGDGDYETDWDRKTHPRHMGIKEMEEVSSNAKPDRKLSELAEQYISLLEKTEKVEYEASFYESVLLDYDGIECYIDGLSLYLGKVLLRVNDESSDRFTGNKKTVELTLEDFDSLVDIKEGF